MFLHCMAILPLPLLYCISDVLYLFIYHIIRYRRKIAEKNIDEAFPEKSEKERRKIKKDFYRHFTDIFVETIKLLHVSDEEMRRRIVFRNMEELDKSIEQGRSVVMYAGHFCNWEWLSSITLWSRFSTDTIRFGQVYRPLRNKWFDRFFLELRKRFNSHSYPMKTVLRDLISARRDNKITVTGFISDQRPGRNDNDNVIMFLNHYTAFITGSEVIAKKMDMDVLFFDVRLIKRGYYECNVHVISRNAKDTAQYELTNCYARLLEKRIQEQPAMWLWTHNRWSRNVSPKQTDQHE